MSFSSLVYGLGLEYNLPIAGLQSLPRPHKVDVRLHLGFFPESVQCLSEHSFQHVLTGSEFNAFGEPDLLVFRTADERYQRLDYSDGTSFLISGAFDEVWVTWPAHSSIEDMAAYLLGPVLGYLLRLRGTTCLHASCVAIGTVAIALVGPSGSGKSSTAAAFAQLGFPVLSDDVVVLQPYDDRFEVLPAYPRLRLWPNSVEGLFGNEDALPRISPTWDKRFLDLRGEPRYRFHEGPLPLAAVYLLGERQRPEFRIGPISPREALMRMVSDTYGARLLSSDRRRQEFQTLSRLVRFVSLREVHAKDDLLGLSALCSAIARDATTSIDRVAAAGS